MVRKSKSFHHQRLMQIQGEPVLKLENMHRHDEMFKAFEGETMKEFEDQTDRITGGGSYRMNCQSTGDIKLDKSELTNDDDKKSRWFMEDAKASLLGELKLPDYRKSVNCDPEASALNRRLYEIAKMLETQENRGKFLSSEHIYHKHWPTEIQMEAVDLDKLIQERQYIIENLINRNPTFNPPSESKPLTYSRKLYIPVKQYPCYNFVSLIIGPCGNTLKRIEAETGAIVLIRGKGSTWKLDRKHNASDLEDLHVLVQAENEDSVDKACKMIEQLLVPVDESKNELKQAQLKELAVLKGRLKENNVCKLNGPGKNKHRIKNLPPRFWNMHTKQTIKAKTVLDLKQPTQLFDFTMGYFAEGLQHTGKENAGLISKEVKTVTSLNNAHFYGQGTKSFATGVVESETQALSHMEFKPSSEQFCASKLISGVQSSRLPNHQSTALHSSHAFHQTPLPYLQISNSVDGLYEHQGTLYASEKSMNRGNALPVHSWQLYRSLNSYRYSNIYNSSYHFGMAHWNMPLQWGMFPTLLTSQ